MSYFKVGYHDGSGGNSVGIGPPDGYMPTLDAAGLPFGIVSADDHGVIEESYQFTRADHFRGFRLTQHATPNYSVFPTLAANQMWVAVLNDLPTAFDKDKCWIIIANEPDREKPSWLGDFGYYIGQLALRDGYRVALWGWSVGTPEPDAWFTMGMVRFLKLAEQHPQQIAVALHEYSLDVTNIMNAYPYLVGRFQFLFDACDELLISRPTTFITEVGWTYNDAPALNVAMNHIGQLADVYSEYHHVKYSTLWYLGGGPEYSGICNKVQPTIGPTTQMALMYSPPTPPESLEQYFWCLSKETQCISLNADALLQKLLLEEGRTPVGTEVWADYPPGSGKQYAYMGGEDPTHEHKPRLVSIAKVPAPGGQWEGTTFDDPGGATIPPTPVLELTHWPTDYKVITQEFGVNPDNYDDYCDDAGLCLPGHNGIDIRAPLGSPFRAAVAGKVIWVSDQSVGGGASGYGWHIRVKTGDYVIIYAHAAPNIPVAVGDLVVGGQILGFSGNTGNSYGPHLHWEMRECDLSPAEWPWCIIDPTPYLEPLMEDPPTPGNIDMLRYFRAVPEGHGPFTVLQHNTGITENAQIMVSGENVYIVKNAQYEHLRVTGSHVERKEDTSPGSGSLYTLDDGYGWSKWCPRYWLPGDVFRRSPTVTFYKYNCDLISTSPNVVSYLRFVAHHQSWTSPPSDASPTGVRLPNVAEMSFMFAEDGEVIERYWFAHGVGLVQWMNNQGAHSWVSELPHGRDPLIPDITNCI